MARTMDNAILETILQRVRPLIGQGNVADYIPALASVEGSKLGIAICTVDGQHYQAGDAHERFSIQSISKVLSLVVAMRHYPEEEIWQRVGKDPSGSPFNSLVQLEMEQGIPRNPFINAGALVVCDMLQGRLSAPRQRMLEVVRALCGVSDITYDATVARSEFEHSARNAAALNGMTKFRTRILPQLLEGQQANGQLPVRLTFALAALIAFYRGERSGESYPVQDDAFWIERYAQLWRQHRDQTIDTAALVKSVLAEKGHWGQDLTCITGLVEQVTTYLDTILENGMRNAVQPLC